jgi:hypothetical protein
VGKTLGKIIYLVDAPPNAEVTNTVRRDAHGLVAEAIYSVTEGDSPRRRATACGTSESRVVTSGASA